MDFDFSEKYEPLFELLEARNVIESKEFDSFSDEDKNHWIALSKIDTVLLSGGRDCFVPNQEVITSNGAKKIKDITKGDLVQTFNERTKEREFQKVFKTKEVITGKTVKINLKNGTTIECTLDHEFFSNGCWVKAKDLLSLWYGDLEEDT